MRTVLALLAVVAVALAAKGDFEFIGGVNLTDAEASFAFRYIGAKKVGNVLLWTSASAEATASDDVKAKADGMVGFGISTPVGPMALGVYAKGSAYFDIKADELAKNIEASFDPKLSVDAVYTAVPFVLEVDKNDKIVYTHFLPRVKPCEDEGHDGVFMLTCEHNPLPTILPLSIPKVMVKFVSSDKAGILKYGHTPVSPRSFEMIIEGEDFKLKSEKNHLRLVVVLVTASVEAGMDGDAKVLDVNGTSVYSAVTEYAIVDGKRVKVDVSVKTGNGDAEDAIKTMLEILFAGKFDARFVNVDLPAGKTDFIYDPAIGYGKNVYEAGASTAVLSLAVVFVCALLALF